jgi:hypothetical protein
MIKEFSVRLQEVDQATLIPFVCAVVGNETAVVVDWAIAPVAGGATQDTGRTYGLYRFTGTAQVQDKIVPWSLILKARAGSLKVSQEPTSWGYWKREVLAYQSGLLADLPGNIVAPRCYGVVEYPGEEFWIWLEDIPAEPESIWSLERYGLAARHLGQFNGAYLVGQPLPEKAWLSSGRVREWLDRCEPVLRDLPDLSQHPLAQRWFEGDSVERTLRLWREQAAFLKVLDGLPRSLCHHDAFRRNLISRRRPEGHEQTVAIDWEIVGTGAIGEEIATLVGVSLQFLEFPMSQAHELDAIVFESYISGLRDAGWTGDECLVRFGFAATAALFIGVGAAGIFLKAFLSDDGEAICEKIFGCTLKYLADQYAVLQDYLLDLGDEARELMDDLT